MREQTRTLDDLKKDLLIIGNQEMEIVMGGRSRSGNWNSTCGGIVPQ